jgi:hypothetical protein
VSAEGGIKRKGKRKRKRERRKKDDTISVKKVCFKGKFRGEIRMCDIHFVEEEEARVD